MAGEPGFSHDFKGLVKSPLISLYFRAASDRGCHLCALALGISQQGGRAAIVSALGPDRAFEPASPQCCIARHNRLLQTYPIRREPNQSCPSTAIFALTLMVVTAASLHWEKSNTDPLSFFAWLGAATRMPIVASSSSLKACRPSSSRPSLSIPAAIRPLGLSLAR